MDGIGPGGAGGSWESVGRTVGDMGLAASVVGGGMNDVDMR